MTRFPLLDQIASLPAPADAEKAAREVAKLPESAAAVDPGLEPLIREFAADPRGAGLLEAILGNSPFLSHCLRAEPALLAAIARDGLDAAIAGVHDRLAGEIAGADTGRLMAALRRARRRIALAVAVADIAGVWRLDQVTAALTGFAERALSAAVGHLLARAVQGGDLALPDPARPEGDSGFIVLGMGKLGGRELNYSSDIDLILLYDRDKVDYRGRKSALDCYLRLARELVRVLQERTVDGYVFRTDLRLRPDPAATPAVLSVEAAEHYYEGYGQNWERAAMIKARPVAGDLAAGDEFLARITPFVWRKYLDFTAIQDIHSIKRQIHAARGHAKIRAEGHNIKLGRGGIREIEFFAQTQQLIAGGRDPRLRAADTCGALTALAETGRLEAGAAAEMIEAYGVLRRIEHRLQMIDDEQTQTLPDEPRAFQALATFLGYDSAMAFRRHLTATLEAVERHYGALFEDAPELGAAGSLSFTGSEDDPETIATLAAMGFKDPAVVTAGIRKWHHGRYRATRSTRAREILTELAPALLQALARTADPDTAFVKFDEFLGGLPSGVQLFSLFYANPGLLDLVAEVMGSAPRLAALLSHNARLFDAVISLDFFAPLADPEELGDSLDRELAIAPDFQDVLDVTRRWAAERRFQAGVQVLRNVTDANGVGPALTAIAEVAISRLLPRVEALFAEHHGRVPEASFVVVGLGKLGGRELAPASDLDLIFVYDCPRDVVASEGPRPLPVNQYFARLSQRLISAITALTGEGRLYEVDMRLRPSGSAGPIATGFEAFVRYHRESAWVWEHMALTRARVLCGDQGLAEQVGAAIAGILTMPREATALRRAVADMRRRIEAEHGTENPWQVKHVRGGLIDLEFIAQYFQLLHGADDSSVLSTNTAEAFRRLGAAGFLDQRAAATLIAATVLARNVQGLLRLCTAGPFDEATAPDGMRNALARAGRASSFEALRNNLCRAQSRVHDLFEELIGPPAAAPLEEAKEQSEP